MCEELKNFKNKNLLIQALSHRSSIHDKSSGTTAKSSNERLEFLGDAVLELATTLFLFKKFKNKNEGDLTAYRSALVKTETLGKTAIEMGIDKMVFLSKGEENSGGRENLSLLADTFEAVIGAFYLEYGFETVFKLLEKYLFYKIDKIIEQKAYKSPKTIFQEYIQAKGLPTPTYELVKEFGPDHDKRFVVNVLVDGKIMGTGEGKNKQQAQQNAALFALESLNVKNDKIDKDKI